MNPFYQGITDFIFLEDSPQRADVIFVPGNPYPDTAKYAAHLYQQGYAPYVLPSGKSSIKIKREDVQEHVPWDYQIPGSYESEYAFMKAVLMEQGVPESAVLKEDQAEYTYQNAIFSRARLMQENIPVQTAILCCQAFHARRCHMYYQEQFPDVRLLVCPVVTFQIGKDNWFQTSMGIDTVLGEVEKCGAQFHEIMKEKKNDQAGSNRH